MEKEITTDSQNSQQKSGPASISIDIWAVGLALVIALLTLGLVGGADRVVGL